jgi:putative salt-induced outer membrane protein YdiY
MRFQTAMWKPVTSTVIAALAISGAAYADDTNSTANAPDADGTWASRAQLGYSKTGGVTDTTSLNGLFHVAHTWDQWKFLFGVEGFYGATEGTTTAQSWDGYLQANYNINDHFYWFGRASELSNKFSGFAYQQLISTGPGYQFINTDATKLSAQVGIGGVRLQTDTFTPDAVGGITPGTYQTAPWQTETVVDAQVKFEHNFNTITKIIAGYEINSGSLNTMQSGNVSLQVKMSSRLSLAVGYSLVTNTKPPPGIGKSASLETVNLVYTLKNKNLAPE